MRRLVVALAAEARPLIAAFGLRAREPAGAFRVFEADETALVVSGVGKVAAAAATGYLEALIGDGTDAAWLNVGIAGHATRAIGEGVLAHRVVDRSSGKKWYPPLVFEPPGETEEVITVDTPETVYSADAAFDMEAAGFYATACRFSTAEIVHSYKVISDNASSPADDVTPSRIETWIGGRLAEVQQLLSNLDDLAGQLAALGRDPPGMEAFTARWRFTVTERRQLRRLLARWHTLRPHDDVWCEEIRALAADRRRDALRWLERKVDALPVELT